jgi:hypothetical protein
VNTKRKKKGPPIRQLFNRRYGRRWGRLLESLSVASHSLSAALEEKLLLPTALRLDLEDLMEEIRSLEQRAWKAEDADANKTEHPGKR